MAIRLIATDLDNTLLRRDKTISPYTAAIFEKCKSAGIITAFATARSGKSLERFSSVIKPDIIISNGGALAKYGTKTLYYKALSHEIANPLIKRLINTPETIKIAAETENGYLINFQQDPRYIGSADYAHAMYSDFSEGIDCAALKISIESANGRAAQGIIADFPDIEYCVFSDSSWGRLSHKDATKEKALAAVASSMGIVMNEIVAFGDDFNDIEMLKACGTGVAMSNAIEEAKNAADCNCGDCDDDGVARWIEERIPL